MTIQREKQHQGEGDGGDEMITITFKNADGLRDERKVKKGTGVKQFLTSHGHVYGKGLTYRLNKVLLQTNKETGELVDDAVLEENAILVIERNFSGGSKNK